MSRNDDADRWNSAAGWDGSSKEEKAESARIKKKFAKQHARMLHTGTALTVSDANEVFDDTAYQPEPQMLFGEMFRRGELSILFADTGMGKTALAVQIAEAIARGTPALVDPTNGHAILSNEAPPLRVLYLDFELTATQFAERYSGGFKNGRWIDRYNFAHQRGVMDFHGTLPEGFRDFSDYMFHSIRQEVEHADAEVLIVDNITYLSGSISNGTKATSLMKVLKDFKDSRQMSILVLAHTPKRPYARPLTVNDLQGSKMISNFADSVFAVGKDSRRSDIRYIKLIKSRSTINDYGPTNVLTCRLTKFSPIHQLPLASASGKQKKNNELPSLIRRGAREGGVVDTPLARDAGRKKKSAPNFLGFVFEKFSDEYEHLNRPYDNANSDRQSLKLECRRLSDAGISLRTIARRLNLSVTTTARYLKE